MSQYSGHIEKYEEGFTGMLQGPLLHVSMPLNCTSSGKVKADSRLSGGSLQMLKGGACSAWLFQEAAL